MLLHQSISICKLLLGCFLDGSVQDATDPSIGRCKGNVSHGEWRRMIGVVGHESGNGFVLQRDWNGVIGVEWNHQLHPHTSGGA
jgi:hypothetical protein